jgi:hypothetical protein
MFFMNYSTVLRVSELWPSGPIRVMQSRQVAPVLHNVENRHCSTLLGEY